MTSTTTRRPSKAQLAREQKAEAIAQLRELFPIGSTVTTNLVHVSSSGMMRSVQVLRGAADGSVRDLSYLVARALGDKVHDKGGIKIGGCGFDAGFQIVYNLGRTLYTETDECAGAECTNPEHDREYNPLPRPWKYGHERSLFTCTGVDSSGPWFDRASRCPANDHVNERTPDFTPGRIHSDPGYALNHSRV